MTWFKKKLKSLVTICHGSIPDCVSIASDECPGS